MTTSPAPVSVARRVIVGIIIVSFGLAALGGIAVLLGAPLGEDIARVLGTTAIVGVFSVAVLCCAALLGRSLQVFGLVGSAVAVLAAVLCIIQIWYDGPYDGLWDELGRLTWSAGVASGAFALASLLLLLSDRRRTVVRVGLWITLALIGVTAAMIIYRVWADAIPNEDLFWRSFGVVAILAALGAIVVPVLSLLLPDAADASARRLPGALAARLVDEAERRGISVEELVAPVLGPAPGIDIAVHAPAGTPAPDA